MMGGKQENPADKAMPYIEKIGGMAKEQYNPWINQGQEAQQGNQALFKEITQNPTDYWNKLQAGYTPSKGYQYKQEQAQKAASAAARASGIAGTGADQSNQMDIVQKILSQGEGQYMEQILNMLGMGAQGQENIANRGFGATSALTDTLGSQYATQGELAFQGQREKNQRRMDRGKMLTQLAAALAGGAMGGAGGAAGGFGGAGGGGGMPAGWGSNNPADFFGYGQKNYYNQFGGGM